MTPKQLLTAASSLKLPPPMEEGQEKEENVDEEEGKVINVQEIRGGKVLPRVQ